MAETENIPSPPESESASAPRVCCINKGRFIWPLLILVLLACVGYAAFLHYPRPGVLVPVIQRSPELGVLEQRLDALETRLNALGEAVPASQATGESASLNEEIKKLRDQVESKNAQDRQTVQKVVASAFAFWDLRESAKDGFAFAPQLAALRDASVGDAEVLEKTAKLEPYAAEGVPTLARLREALTEEEKAAPSPVAKSNDASLWTRIREILQPLISVRPLHDARFSLVEKALDSSDGPAALEAARVLPEDARKNLAAWQAKLEARVALDDVLRALTAHFTTSLSQGSAP